MGKRHSVLLLDDDIPQQDAHDVQLCFFGHERRHGLDHDLQAALSAWEGSSHW